VFAACCAALQIVAASVVDANELKKLLRQQGPVELKLVKKS